MRSAEEMWDKAIGPFSEFKAWCKARDAEVREDTVQRCCHAALNSNECMAFTYKGIKAAVLAVAQPKEDICKRLEKAALEAAYPQNEYETPIIGIPYKRIVAAILAEQRKIEVEK